MTLKVFNEKFSMVDLTDAFSQWRHDCPHKGLSGESKWSAFCCSASVHSLMTRGLQNPTNTSEISHTERRVFIISIINTVVLGTTVHLFLFYWLALLFHSIPSQVTWFLIRGIMLNTFQSTSWWPSVVLHKVDFLQIFQFASNKTTF